MASEQHIITLVHAQQFTVCPHQKSCSHVKATMAFHTETFLNI